MNHFINYLIVFILSFSIQNGYSQFPSLKGKESSGIFPVLGSNNNPAFSGNYEITKTNLGLTFIQQKEDSEDEPDGNLEENLYDRWSLLKINRYDIAIGLDEFTFNPLGENFDAKFDFSYTHARLKNTQIKSLDNKKLFLYNGFQIKPILSLIRQELLYYTNMDSTELSTNKEPNWNLGANVSYTRMADSDLNGAEWAWSLGGFMGIDINNVYDLKKYQICNLQGSNLTFNNSQNNLQKCKNYLWGNPNDSFLLNAKFDLTKRLSIQTKNDHKKIGTPKPTFSKPALFFLTRIEVDYRSNFNPKGNKSLETDLLTGLSFARSDRQVLASFIVSLLDLLDIFEKQNSNDIQITLEIPIAGN